MRYSSYKQVLKRFLLWIVVGVPCYAMLMQGCKSTTLKEAEWLHQQKQYHAAADSYYKLYQRTPRKKIERKAYLAFRAAENYRLVGHSARAYNSYARAQRMGYPDSIVTLRLAQELHKMGKYKEAAAYYRLFLESHPQDYFARIGLAGVTMADSLLRNPSKHRVTPARQYNSSSADFSAAYSAEGDEIYFTSSRSKAPSIEKSLITGLKPNDLYVVKKNAQGVWQRPDSLPGGINTIHDEGIPAFSPDGRTLYYSYAEQEPDGKDATVQIFQSAKSGDGGRVAGTLVEIWSDSLRMAAHPAVNQSGSMLYFVSEGGFGGKDIYAIPLKDGEVPTGAYPSNLGAAINTPGDELFPTMWGDSTLFFSSDGHPGLGGLDLFMAQLDSTGNWQVKNLGSPINSSADDFSLALSLAPAKGLAWEGLLSSNRKEGRGRPHLYAVSLPAMITEIDGLVTDREGNPIAGAVVRVVDHDGTVKSPQIITREDGSYLLSVTGSNRYLLHASHPDYLNRYAAIQTQPTTENTTYFVDFVLASRIHPEALHEIYYDFDAATLRPQSKKALDELIKILKDNPGEVLEISAHADRKGSQQYNQNLTTQRALAVVEYLIAQGISREQLKHQGYSHSKPYVVSEAMHKRFPFLPQGQALTPEFIAPLTPEQQIVCDQLNRRTEFEVIPQ